MTNESFLIKSIQASQLREFKDKIGQKAFGLFECDHSLVPKFLVISSDLFNLWKRNNDLAISELNNIAFQIKEYFTKKYIIVRSSAKQESLTERGFYISSTSKISIDEVVAQILNLWKENLTFVESIKENEFSVIIQEYIKPNYLGHLSNERSISKNKDEWFYEIINSNNEFIESNRFSVNEINSSSKIYSCNNKNDVIETLKNIAFDNSHDRFHFEWIWDGNKVWVVQKDCIQVIKNDYRPGSDWNFKNGQIKYASKRSFNVLNSIETTTGKWKKINCLESFNKCNLPIGDVYILEGEGILSNIYSGVFSDSLIEDFNWLLTFPIVIRMDINVEESEEFLLPRTETLFKLEEVKEFLKTKLIYFKEKNVSFDKICFLLHRFIISKACALAFSKPDIPRTRIDSTWGIVDGLYYHPHDSFEINTSNSLIKKLIRCKTEFLDTDKNGKWISRKCNDKLDWKESLTDSELKQISQYNETLATYLKKPVTVMYFVGVFKETGYPQILPWYYTEEFLEKSEKFSESIFAEKRFYITNKEDFNNLQCEFKELKLKYKILIKLKLIPDILRDREFIEEIGKYASENKIPIEIEGSILSHPYYILKKQNAFVKIKNPFEPNYQRQKFYKLVRDKIPIQIESKGEIVRTIKISPQQTLFLIKQKIIEEAYEYFWEEDNDKLIEELADIFELIRSASKIFSTDISEIEKIADKKKEKKGGFESGTFLIDTKEKALIEIVTEESEMNITFPFDSYSGIDKKHESIIPSHKKCSYSNDVLSISYFPSFIDNKTNKRIETLSINKENEFIVEFHEKKITVKISKKNKDYDFNQLQLSFD